MGVIIFSNYQIRLANSVIKFVEATTRVQLLRTANKHAVDKAYHLLSRKLDFLKQLIPYLELPSYKQSKKSCFKRWLYKVVGKNVFEPEKVIRRYISDNYPCSKVKERTIRNWLDKLAVKEQHKKWRIKKDILQEIKKGI